MGRIACVSAASASSTHPRRVVTNAFIRRGAKVYSTEGAALRFPHNMPYRIGFGPANPVPFYNAVEGKVMPQVPLGNYRVRAQLAPALIVLLPTVVSVVTWIPDAIDLVRALVGARSPMFFLAQVRDAGRRKEAWLHSRSAPPRRTRCGQGIRLSSKMRARGYVAVARGRGGRPQGGRFNVQFAVQWLLAQAPDRRRFPLVFQENVNYGFRRNLWGLRPAGLMIATTCLVANVAAIFAAHNAENKLHVEGLIALIITSLLVFLWIKIVKPDWVRVPAFAYARALFQMCEVLSADMDRATERNAVCVDLAKVSNCSAEPTALLGRTRKRQRS